MCSFCNQENQISLEEQIVMRGTFLEEIFFITDSLNWIPEVQVMLLGLLKVGRQK